MPGWAFAFGIRSSKLRYPSYLFAGEDLGIPVALLDCVAPLKSAMYIITHGSYMASPKFKWLMSLFKRKHNIHFLPLAESVGDLLVNEFGVHPSRVHNTGYGIDTHYFQPAEKVDSPLIVSAGMASRDYQALVSAVTPLGVPLRIAADSAWFPQAVNIDTSNLPAFIDVRSAGNYVGLRSLYAQASFVVVPLENVKHACGYAVIGEAMAMGKAVIATRTQTPSDFVIDGVTGFLVQPGDVEGLRDKIRWCLEHPEEVAGMGARARQHIVDNYSVEVYCSKIASAIAQTSSSQTKLNVV